MDKINAVITGVDGYVPDDVLTNADLSKMVDTTDEWIMTRVGIKERRILKDPQLGTAYMEILNPFIIQIQTQCIIIFRSEHSGIADFLV